MKKILVLFTLVFISTVAFGQSARMLDQILESKKVTFGQVCYISAVHQGLVDENAGFRESIDALYKKGQIPKLYYEDTTVPIVNLACLYAQMWDIKGGLFYKIFRGSPRYAFKQLKCQGVIPSNTDPHLILSGKEALALYTACSLKYGNRAEKVE